MLRSVDEVIDAVGGPSAASRLIGKASNVASNWKNRRRIPPEHFLVFADELRRKGLEADPAIFGITPAEEARA